MTERASAWLTYAPARARQRALLWVTVCAVLGAILCARYLAWPKYKEFAAKLEQHHLIADCESYCLPPSVVAFEPTIDRATILLGSSDYRPWTADTPYAVRVIKPWDVLARQMGLVAEGAAVFCHARRSPGGNERLVVISSIASGLARGCVIDVRAEKPILRRASWLGSRGLGSPYYILGGPHRREATIFAGQPDQTDLSHFTIRYRCANAEGVIDGWLLDDDYLRLRALTGPCRRSLSYFEEAESEWNGSDK
jgi:hypothetical protein